MISELKMNEVLPKWMCPKLLIIIIMIQAHMWMTLPFWNWPKKSLFRPVFVRFAFRKMINCTKIARPLWSGGERPITVRETFKLLPYLELINFICISGGPSAQKLQEVAIPVWTNKECQQSYSSRINENNVCAGAREGGKDSCQVRSLLPTHCSAKFKIAHN